ncbi:peptide methionine sulfoxide reductase A1-like [Brassica napus]|uniref:peptide methionine sulfoxide reductase A1-like n=1 Tax=Brassica napus TaxID=3708 RepID=UPI0020785742|nr:peptide methionine sulfoxide reductase A1-like [Brassica napus]
MHNPSYEDACSGTSNHVEVVRNQYDLKECRFESLLELFWWSMHDPTTLNRQGNNVGSQYRSGIYYYNPEQEKLARESLEYIGSVLLESHQQHVDRKIVTEILPATKFYRAEEDNQQYLSKGGRFGLKQSSAKGCNDPIRCYG